MELLKIDKKWEENWEWRMICRKRALTSKDCSLCMWGTDLNPDGGCMKFSMTFAFVSALSSAQTDCISSVNLSQADISKEEKIFIFSPCRAAWRDNDSRRGMISSWKHSPVSLVSWTCLAILWRQLQASITSSTEKPTVPENTRYYSHFLQELISAFILVC